MRKRVNTLKLAQENKHLIWKWPKNRFLSKNPCPVPPPQSFWKIDTYGTMYRCRNGGPGDHAPFVQSGGYQWHRATFLDGKVNHIPQFQLFSFKIRKNCASSARSYTKHMNYDAARTRCMFWKWSTFREENFPIKIKSKENQNVYLFLLALWKVEKYIDLYRWLFPPFIAPGVNRLHLTETLGTKKSTWGLPPIFGHNPVPALHFVSTGTKVPFSEHGPA